MNEDSGMIRRKMVVLTALKVSLVVGILLNLINQSDKLLGGGQPFNYFQMLLNFIVPFCVSSYSAARTELGKHGHVAPPSHEK